MDYTLKVLRKIKEKDFLKFRKRMSDRISNAQSHVNKEVEMISMNLVKKSWKRGLAGVMLAAIVSAVPSHAAVVAGGTVPLENYFVAYGNTGVDVASANATLATGVLATIYINNNAPNSFSLIVTQQNGGFLRLGLLHGLPTINTTGNPFTATDIVHTATPSLAPEVKGFTAANLAATALTAGAGGANAVYSPGAATTASVEYGVDIRATWIAATTLLAGFYQESFTVSLVAVM
jgi:hypothetical protein